MSRLLDVAADAALALGVLALLGLMVHVSADVLAKYLVGEPFVGTIEAVSSYWMLGCVFLPLAVVQRERQQIVVEVLTHRLPPRALAFVECFACILTAAFVGGLAWAGMLEAIDQTMAGETTNSTSARFAVWPTRWFPVVGYLGTFIYLSIQSVRAIGAAARRGPSE